MKHTPVHSFNVDVPGMEPDSVKARSAWALRLLQMQAAVSNCKGNLDCVMQVVLDAAISLIPAAESGTIQLAADGEAVLRAIRGRTTAKVGDKQSLKRTLAAWCLETGEAACSGDLQLDPRTVGDPNNRDDARALIIVPLPFQGRQIGFMKLESSRPHAFSGHDLLMAQVLAGPLVIGMATTAHAQAEQDRQTAHRRFVATFEQAAVGIAHVAPDGKFMLVNNRFCEIVGHDRDVLLGGGFQAITHPGDLAADLQKVADLLEGRSATYSIEKRFIREDRSLTWVNLTVSLVRDCAGQPDFFVAVIEDITSRRSAEEATEAKSTFLANMSHELRTPMNAVLGFAELLLDSQINSRERRQVELILESGRAMMRLLNDILDLSKIESGHMQVELEPVDLRHTLKSIVQFMQPVAEKKGLTLSYLIPDVVPRTLLLDKLKLRQVLLNLLGNALKFTERGSVRVSVNIEGSPAMIAIRVHDTGFGITESNLKLIFADFVQGREPSRKGSGTGLGLSISRNLARLMQGDLDAQSTVGEGSTFTLWLPANAVDQSVKALRSPVLPGAHIEHLLPTAAKEVLLVEDHDINQEYMIDLLGRLGVRVDVANDGFDALEHVKCARDAGRLYDLVLMDVQMPGMDGLEASRAIRRLGITSNELPIVALSANAYADDIEACFAAGMQQHLSKPLAASELIVALNAFPRRRGLASADLRQKYVKRRDQTLRSVHSLMSGGALGADEIREVKAALHKLAGTAAIFGEAALGSAARHMEAALRNLPAQGSERLLKQTFASLQEAANDLNP